MESRSYSQSIEMLYSLDLESELRILKAAHGLARRGLPTGRARVAGGYLRDEPFAVVLRIL